MDFATATLHVRRVKQGTPSAHPILGDELRALRRLQREQEPKSPFVFTSERGAPFSTAGFARMVERAGMEAQASVQGAPAHAAARLRLRAGEQGARHARAASLSRAPEHPAHGALHRVVADAVQGFLARVTGRPLSVQANGAGRVRQATITPLTASAEARTAHRLFSPRPLGLDFSTSLNAAQISQVNLSVERKLLLGHPPLLTEPTNVSRQYRVPIPPHLQNGTRSGI